MNDEWRDKIVETLCVVAGGFVLGGMSIAFVRGFWAIADAFGLMGVAAGLIVVAGIFFAIAWLIERGRDGAGPEGARDD